MNVFNRLLIILLDLVMLVSVVAIFLVTVGLYTPADLAPSPWFRNRLTTFTNLDSTTWNWTVGLCVLLFIAGLVLLYFEIPKPRPTSELVVKRDPLGEVTVTQRGVREVAERAAAEVPGVMEATSRVGHDAQGLRVMTRVSVDPTANVPQVTELVQNQVRDAVQHFTGRKVAEVRVETQLGPLAPSAPVR